MNIISITKNHFEYASKKKIISASEYRSFVKASQAVREANKRAKQIEKEAQEQYEKEKERGFEEGLMESKIQQSEQMLKMVDKTVNYLADVEKTMADVLMSAVKKIIEGFDDNALVVGMIKSALQHVRNEQQVTVRVPPAQYAYVKEQIADILAEYKGVGFINPVSDERLSKGSCILESKMGVIDASTDVQLEALRRRFARLSSETLGALAEKNTEDKRSSKD